MVPNINRYEEALRKAVQGFWATRKAQSAKQKAKRTSDQGARGDVTGGAQMDGFADLVARIVREAGIPDAGVFRRKAIELPGFFRASKKWDTLIVVDGKLLAAIELKSQVGPSFGNNVNNRAEEAIGSAVDLWTAYREGAFHASPRPWLGYMFLLEECERSLSPVAAAEPHFPVFPEFQSASYAKRYELLCRKLVRERHYNAVSFLTSGRDRGMRGEYREPTAELAFREFAASLVGHVCSLVASKGGK